VSDLSLNRGIVNGEFMLTFSCLYRQMVLSAHRFGLQYSLVGSDGD